MTDARALYVSNKRICITKEGDNDPLALTEQSKKDIDLNWEKLLEKRPNLFSSRLLRLIKAEEKDDEVTISVSDDIFYKDVVGLRYNEGFEPRKIDSEDIFQSLSCYIFIKTSDNKLIFTSRDCGDWNAALDFPGGFIQDKYSISDIKDFARERTISDLSIETSAINTISSLGTFDFKEILEYMAVYIAQLHITLDELKKISKVDIFEIPPEYTVREHNMFFTTRLHFAAIPILESFLDIARR